MCDFVDIESNDFTVANALKMKSIDMVSEISNKDDTEILRRLARHSKPLVSSSLESRRVCSTLCNILFAYVNIRSHFTMFVLHTHTHRYAYDRRITNGDPNVESGWNIWNISPSLSWLDRFESPRDALNACLDRSLIFPYARLWTLSMRCVVDVQTILRHGRRT